MEGANHANHRAVANGNIPNGTLANGLTNTEMLRPEPPAPNLRELIASGLREQMQEMRKDVLDQVNERIDDMVSEIIEKVETAKPGKTTGLMNSDKYRDKVKTSSAELLPSKQFQERNSMLTDLFEIPHIRTIYNIFIVILFLMFVHTAVEDLLGKEVPSIGINTILLVFGKLDIALHTWLYMKCSVVGMYAGFCAWAYQREQIQPNSTARKMWDYGWLSVLLVYEIMFCVLSTKEVVKNVLPVASSLVVLMEQVRIIMKVHAFVRSNAPRFLAYKPHSDLPLPKTAGLSHFLYFMFAPTLVYRESYPRTKRIRWGRALYYLLEVLMSIFFMAFMFERFVLPAFKIYGGPEHDSKSLILNIFVGMICGILFFLCGFYLLLHSWLNAAAELLCFADRLFYKDWWTSTTYSRYYRTWNVVVHDWLHAYIYKDFYERVAPRNKFLSTIAVFFISAIFHEYILAFAFGFFYPVLLFFFLGIGCTLQVLGKRTGNMFIWMSLIVGNGFLMSLYSMEYYARVNCPAYWQGLPDLLVPRSWFCPTN